jgi:hypothetical protein
MGEVIGSIPEGVSDAEVFGALAAVAIPAVVDGQTRSGPYTDN